MMNVADIMDKFAQALAKAVKKARTDQGLTQQQVANMIHCNVRTVLKIENCQGNPKMETICLLIYTLKIDAREIFNPELECQSPAIQSLRYTVEDCSEQEAATLVPVIESVLKAIRSSRQAEIK